MLTERQTPAENLNRCPKCGEEQLRASYEVTVIDTQRIEIVRDEHGALTPEYTNEDWRSGNHSEPGDDIAYSCGNCDGEWDNLYHLDHARRVIAAAVEEENHAATRVERLAALMNAGRIDTGALQFDPLNYWEGRRDALASVAQFLREQL